jgi:hypothetical protein
MDNEKKLITLNIMDRTGHTTREVGFDDALEVAKEEMGNGKWLRIVADDGSSDILTDATALAKDLTSIRNLFEGAKELDLVMALVGGADEIDGFVEVGGKYYPSNAVQGLIEAHGIDCKKDVATPKPDPDTLRIRTRITDNGANPALWVDIGAEGEGYDYQVVFNNALGQEVVLNALAALLHCSNKQLRQLVNKKASVIETVEGQCERKHCACD